MRIFPAALLGAAALPSLAYATDALGDPTDAAAPVPALSAPFAFTNYQPYQADAESTAATWQALNRAVTASPKMARSARQEAAIGPAAGDHEHAAHNSGGAAK